MTHSCVIITTHFNSALLALVCTLFLICTSHSARKDSTVPTTIERLMYYCTRACCCTISSKEIAQLVGTYSFTACLNQVGIHIFHAIIASPIPTTSVTLLFATAIFFFCASIFKAIGEIQGPMQRLYVYYLYSLARCCIPRFCIQFYCIRYPSHHTSRIIPQGRVLCYDNHNSCPIIRVGDSWLRGEKNRGE